MQIVADATNVIAEGEVLQLLNMHDPDVTEERYLKVIAPKQPSCLKQRRNRRSDRGREEQVALPANMAVASAPHFKLIDDVLDYSGTQKKSAKTSAMICAKANQRCR
jgi:octaprenyl-diphosphate synthase